MYIDVVPNRDSPPAVLLRESYRENGRVKKRTLANISNWPRRKVDGLRRVLKGEQLVSPQQAFEIERSLPHGHVAAVLGTLRRTKLDRVISSKRTPDRDLVIAMVVARIIEPRSKLATTRGIRSESASSSLGEVLGLGDTDEDQLYEAMDWLFDRQERIENALAKRHLEDGTLALYDVTSTYFEGRHCPLAALGKSRDGKRGTLQITIGLLCAEDGCPIAIQVFEGNTGDPTTLAPQIDKLRDRFGLKRVILVGDRGMITAARIREDIKPRNTDTFELDWITALRSPSIRQLIEDGAIDRSLFDELDLAEITQHPDYPGERLVVCRNPLLAAERARKRESLLCATERELEKIAIATKRDRRPLRGKDKIGDRVGKNANRFKVRKHFKIMIDDDCLHYQRDNEKIKAEACLDGFYVVRTSVDTETLNAQDVVKTYKSLSVVESAFRSLKTIDLKVRPIYHWLEKRVRAHVFLCMLAYYVEWHMRKVLAPILFDDHDKHGAEEARSSVVAPAQRSSAATAKEQTKRTDEGLPVHSFRTLLADLGTITRNRVRYCVDDAPVVEQLSRATPIQQKALDLLRVSLV